MFMSNNKMKLQFKLKENKNKNYKQLVFLI